MDKEVIRQTEKYGRYLAEVLVTVDGVEMSMTFSNRRISNLQNLLITKLNHESKKHYSFTFLC
jgi:hypothetical protein